MKKVKHIINFIIFAVVLGLALIYTNYVFRDKELTGAQDAFKKIPASEVDMVFIGNSHQFCTISPQILHDEYGINSFMLATSSQTFAMSYYAAMEAIELKKPSTIVMEVCYAHFDGKTVEDELNSFEKHSFFDGMPMCKARTEGFKDILSKEEYLYYLFPIGLYHSKWKELTKEDFAGYKCDERGGMHFDERGINWELPVCDKDYLVEIPEINQDYLQRIIDLCKANNVRLILYAAPYNTLDMSDEYATKALLDQEGCINFVGEIAKSQGVEFFNLFYEYDDMKFDDGTDWMDPQHLNENGQIKATRYIADKGYLN